MVDYQITMVLRYYLKHFLKEGQFYFKVPMFTSEITSFDSMKNWYGQHKNV